MTEWDEHYGPKMLSILHYLFSSSTLCMSLSQSSSPTAQARQLPTLQLLLLGSVRECGTGVTIQSDLEGILNLKAFSCQYTSTLTNP